ncbi:uncharacterized protein LOC134541487 [Bacillus rossius redtenbacheri]|uniref:uncharacterized protein LOC134541487 n=1 Tax=Bacillus rossius redtenbacheri TaxID=93214 RepID=UPI002FDD879F
MHRKLYKQFHSHMSNVNNKELVFKSPTESYVLSKAEYITENLPVTSSDKLTPEDHTNIAKKSGVSAQSQKIVSNAVKIPYFLSESSNYKDNAQVMKPETFENNNVGQNASLESMKTPHTTSIPLKLSIRKSSLETNKVFTVQNQNSDHKESKIPSLSERNNTSFLVTENSKLRTKNEILSSTYMKIEYKPWMKNSNTTTINYLERMVSFITRNFISLRNLFLFENTDLKPSTSKTGNVSLSHNINQNNSGLYQSTKDSYQQGVLSEGSTKAKKLRRMGEAELEIPNESKSSVKNMKINTIKNASTQSEESEEELLSSIEENRKIFNINEKFKHGMNVGKVSSASQEIKESSEDSDSSEEKQNERSSSDESNSTNDEIESDVSEIDESD